MEKKEYLAPDMEVVELKFSGMLCISNTDDITDPNDPQPGPF